MTSEEPNNIMTIKPKSDKIKLALQQIFFSDEYDKCCGIIEFYDGKISFSTAGRRIGRINREDEGIFADCRSGSAVPVHHQCATLVRLGPTDEGPRENASGVFSESGIRLSDDEGAD